MRRIEVVMIVGENAISMQSGTNLYEQMYGFLKSGEKIELDFASVQLFASPFFNASIGLLLKDFDVDVLQSQLKIVNLDKVGLQLLNHVITNAIKYYDKDSKIADAIKSTKNDPEE